MPKSSLMQRPGQPIHLFLYSGRIQWRSPHQVYARGETCGHRCNSRNFSNRVLVQRDHRNTHLGVDEAEICWKSDGGLVYPHGDGVKVDPCFSE